MPHSRLQAIQQLATELAAFTSHQNLATPNHCPTLDDVHVQEKSDLLSRERRPADHVVHGLRGVAGIQQRIVELPSTARGADLAGLEAEGVDGHRPRALRPQADAAGALARLANGLQRLGQQGHRLGICLLDGEVERSLLACQVPLPENRHLAHQLLLQEVHIPVVHRAPGLPLGGSVASRQQACRRSIAEKGVGGELIHGRLLRLLWSLLRHLLLGLLLLGGRQRPLRTLGGRRPLDNRRGNLGLCARGLRLRLRFVQLLL
mmetsp:Transcript_100522/g.322599  ORF Transcript_100522/g.322599 Transcript_100522/m.322599 type:complete len:262 (-) Transcript_100522:353-1138(-)